MKNGKPQNPAAFPQSLVDNQGRIDASCDYGRGGMSLRDWFAGLAMQRMCAGDGAIMVGNRDANYDEKKGNFAEVVASNAYDFADAMLAERDKRGAA